METSISTKKAISGSFTAIIILVISQTLAQLIASMFLLLRIQDGICNIIAGVLYVSIAYAFLLLFTKKLIKVRASDLGISQFNIKGKWILTAILLPLAVKAVYLLMFNGEYVPSNMNANQIFSTLSAGIVFYGLAAGFVEEMVFRGVILNLLKNRWNIKIAVLVPSVLFGVVHVLGMGFSIESGLLVIIAGTMVGIMFSAIAIEGGSVWNSGIVHAIWNIVIIGGGLSVGENVDEYSVMTYVLDTKAFVITGGEFGIESSVISLMGYIIVAFMAMSMIKS